MVVYHSLSVSDADFISFLVDIVKHLIIKRESIVIGDFNIDFMINFFIQRSYKRQ